jgi:hypothetical protein
MKIWKLTPIDPQAPDFARASSWHGPAVVRAGDSTNARKTANRRLHGVVKIIQQPEETLLGPWENATLVSCEEDFSGDYSSDGAEEVVWPKNID